MPDPQALDLWMEVNVERLQHASTHTMIFPIRHLVSCISRLMVLKAGDTMRLGVNGLGVQQQRVRAWASTA